MLKHTVGYHRLSILYKSTYSLIKHLPTHISASGSQAGLSAEQCESEIHPIGKHYFIFECNFKCFYHYCFLFLNGYWAIIYINIT